MNLISAVFYLCLAGATTLCTALWQRERRNGSQKASCVFAFLTFLFPTFFAAVRYGIGTDYKLFAGYLLVINHNGKLPVRLEPGYVLLNRIVGILHGNEHLLYGVCAGVGVIFIMLVLNRYRNVMNPAYGMLVYMLWYYQLSFNNIRQSLAITIALFALQYITDRKPVKFCLFMAIAFCFHFTSIILVPFYIVYKLYVGKWRKSTTIAVYVGTAFIVLFYSQVLSFIVFHISLFSSYQKYFLPSNQVHGSLGLGIIVPQLILLVPAFLAYQNLKKRRAGNDFLLMLLIVGSILSYLVYRANWINRISYYFTAVQILLIPQIGSALIGSAPVLRMTEWLGRRRARWIARMSNWLGSHICPVYNCLMIAWIVIFWYYRFFYMGFEQTVPYTSIFGRIG